MTTSEDDARVWKEKFEELSEQFEQFQLDSGEIEAELERQLEAARAENHKLAMKLRETDAAAKRIRRQSVSSIVSLTQRVQQSQSTAGAHKEQRRKLEQRADDLERRNRILIAQVDDLQHQLEEALENNVLLMDEIEQIKETHQEQLQHASEQKQAQAAAVAAATAATTAEQSTQARSTQAQTQTPKQPTQSAAQAPIIVVPRTLAEGIRRRRSTSKDSKTLPKSRSADSLLLSNELRLAERLEQLQEEVDRHLPLHPELVLTTPHDHHQHLNKIKALIDKDSKRPEEEEREEEEDEDEEDDEDDEAEDLSGDTDASGDSSS